MLIEASCILGLPVIDPNGNRLARVDKLIFNDKKAQLIGYQVATVPLVRQFRSVLLENVLQTTRTEVVVNSSQSMQKDLSDLDHQFKLCGPILGVTAKTESGRKIGQVRDLLIDGDSGFINRFYLKNLFSERIIPRQYLVAITPKKIIFKDIVGQPIFDQAASAEGLTA